jgi:hypothetical protein
VTVLVQLDLAVRRGQRRLGQLGLELLLAVGDVPVDRLERLDQAPGVHVEAVGERAGRLRGGSAARRVVLEQLVVVLGVARGARGVQVARRAGAADVRARDARPELLELPRRAPEQVADELLGVDRALGLLVGLEERDEPRAADRDERAVDVRGHLLGEGRVVRRVQRREDPLGDLAARGAELAMKPAADVQPKE